MRLQIKFSLSGKKQHLPFNYQYPISAWIYKVLDSADNSFATMLHQNGYVLENGKNFKLFTFSRLTFPKNRWKQVPRSDRMEIYAISAYLTLSFQLPEQIEKFVAGLFKNQQVFIGDKISGIDMTVQNIEVKKPYHFNKDIPAVKLKSITGMVIGADIEGEKYEQYIAPLHQEYKNLFLKNLTDKARAAGIKDVDTMKVGFNILNLSPKTKMQVIKAGTPAETKVRAYNYEFELTAPKELIEVGLNAGFGSMNSLGFGYCEVMGNQL